MADMSQGLPEAVAAPLAANGAALAFGAPKPRMMGLREYARHRASRGLNGTTLGAVQKALSTGRIKAITLGDAKMIDADAADRDWAAHTNAQGVDGSGKAGAQAALPGVEGFERQSPLNGLAGPQDAAETPYAEARAQREIYAAKLLELEYGQKAGMLVRRDLAEREEYEKGRRIKQAMENLPNQLSAILAATSDEHRVHSILKAEIHQILETTARWVESGGQEEAA